MVSRPISTSAVITGFLVVSIILALTYPALPESFEALRSGVALAYLLTMLTTLAYGAKAIIEDF